MQIPFTKVFSILNAIVALRQKFDYPTAQLPPDFHAGPNIRQGRSGYTADSTRSEVKPLPFVTTDVGNFVGYFMKVVSGRFIYAFEGIPYAEKPERFRDPVPKFRIEGNFSATSVGHDCLQTFMGSVTGGRFIFGNEDCLTCNLYSSALISDETNNPNLPVIFNIYGGSFAVGSARDYGPAYLLEQDVVLVNCNYRVGALGFLSTGDAAAPGNWGLKDLALALDWTHKHIRNFGGDPNRIVVMGQSAGAALGHLLLMTPTSKDQISGAVLVSGTALAPWALMDSELALRMTWRFAVMNFCPTNQGSTEMINCLRKRRGWILEATQNIVPITEQWALKFSPVIEPDIPGALITKTPEEYYKQGLVARVPAMFSTNSRDTDTGNILLKLTGGWSLVSKPLLVFLPQVLGYHGKVDIHNENAVTKKILDFYGGMEKIIENRDGLFQAAQDRYFTIGWLKSMRFHSQIAPTFAYVFAYHSNRGLAGKINVNPYEFGVPHAEDLFYLFNRTDIEPISRNDSDFSVVMLFQSIFTNFATNGQPLYTTEDNVDKMIMEPVQPPPSKGFKMLLIDKEVKTVEIPWETNITRFWDSLNIQEFPSLKLNKI